MADPRVFFEYEPPDLATAWIALAGPSSWTDAYLAAFAQQCNLEMVTFDRGFRRWTGLKLAVLDDLQS